MRPRALSLCGVRFLSGRPHSPALRTGQGPLASGANFGVCERSSPDLRSLARVAPSVLRPAPGASAGLCRASVPAHRSRCSEPPSLLPCVPASLRPPASPCVPLRPCVPLALHRASVPLALLRPARAALSLRPFIPLALLHPARPPPGLPSPSARAAAGVRPSARPLRSRCSGPPSRSRGRPAARGRRARSSTPG